MTPQSVRDKTKGDTSVDKEKWTQTRENTPRQNGRDQFPRLPEELPDTRSESSGNVHRRTIQSKTGYNLFYNLDGKVVGATFFHDLCRNCHKARC